MAAPSLHLAPGAAALPPPPDPDAPLHADFSGYACLFDQVDLGRDLIERGAFAESLARRGVPGVRLLYQHEPAEPIGVWREIREDALGLFVRGRLSLSVRRAREVAALMADGAIDGLSIGFKTVAARTQPGTRIRRIARIDLWEISIVTFPMQPGARARLEKGVPTPRARRDGADARALQEAARRLKALSA